jgi:hypothetical protein
MVNQWEQYDDDEAQNGNVLAQYDFRDFDKYDAIPILILFVAIFATMCYYAMLPATTKLSKVGSLLHMLTSPSTFALW